MTVTKVCGQKVGRRVPERHKKKGGVGGKVFVSKHSKLLFLRAQVALLLAHVPVQTLSQAFEPVVDGVAETDGWDGEARCGDGDAAETR